MYIKEPFFLFLQKGELQFLLSLHVSASTHISICLRCFLFQELGAVSLDGYFHLWRAEHNLCKVYHTITNQ